LEKGKEMVAVLEIATPNPVVERDWPKAEFFMAFGKLCPWPARHSSTLGHTKMTMQNIYIAIAIAIFSLSSAAMAAGEPSADARRYVRTYDCSFSKVSAVGAACQDEDTCPNLSMVYSEAIAFVTKNITTQLEPLPKQFPASVRVDPQRVYTLSAVRCHANNEVSILYWGGGNCSRVCEVAARYKLSEAGAVTEKTLIEGRWSALPAVKEYSTFDKQKHTEWLDAK
jgi:hypothetical protein